MSSNLGQSKRVRLLEVFFLHIQGQFHNLLPWSVLMISVGELQATPLIAAESAICSAIIVEVEMDCCSCEDHVITCVHNAKICSKNAVNHDANKLFSSIFAVRRHILMNTSMGQSLELLP